jgi:shikimate kinase
MKIYLLGFMGAGKSFWGKNLAAELKLPYYDLDEVIIAAEEKSVADIFAEKGEAYFRDKEKEALHTLSSEPDFIVSCGGGTPCFFDNMGFMNANGITIWLNPSVEVIHQRLLRKKQKRPLIAQLNDEELVTYIETKLAERKFFYEQSKLIIDSSSGDVSNLATLLSAYQDE